MYPARHDHSAMYANLHPDETKSNSASYPVTTLLDFKSTFLLTNNIICEVLKITKSIVYACTRFPSRLDVNLLHRKYRLCTIVYQALPISSRVIQTFSFMQFVHTVLVLIKLTTFAVALRLRCGSCKLIC